MPSDGLGYFLLFVAFIALAVGLVNLRKAKKLLAAPFKKTGEIGTLGQSPDPKGAISTQGNLLVSEPLIAPCSGKPCAYFEIEVERMWQKTEMTENGAKTSKGTTKVLTEKQGGVFYLDDGSGAATIDARQKAVADDPKKDLVQSFEQVQNVVAGDAYFGQFKATIPYDTSSGQSTVGIKCTERLLTADGQLFVMGKLQGSAITTSDGMLGKLMISRKGREALVGSAQKWSKVGLIAAAITALPGLVVAIFGDHTRSASVASTITDETSTPYSSRIYSKSGTSVEWNVTNAGKYEVAIHGTGKSATYKLWPEVALMSAGEQLAHRESTDLTKLVACVAPGAYTFDIKDSSNFAASGGQGFELTVKKVAESVPCDGQDKRPALTQATLAVQPAPARAAAKNVGSSLNAAIPANPVAPAAAKGDAGATVNADPVVLNAATSAAAPAPVAPASGSASAPAPAPKPPAKKGPAAKPAKH